MKNIMSGSDIETCGDHVDAEQRSARSAGSTLPVQPETFKYIIRGYGNFDRHAVAKSMREHADRIERGPTTSSFGGTLFSGEWEG
jgi:hypothetical protein